MRLVRTPSHARTVTCYGAARTTRQSSRKYITGIAPGGSRRCGLRCKARQHVATQLHLPNEVEIFGELLQQHVYARLNIRFVDVADRTRRGLHKVDDIGAAGQFARRRPLTDVTTHGPIRRVFVFILVEIDLQEAVSNVATAIRVTWLDGSTLDLV